MIRPRLAVRNFANWWDGAAIAVIACLLCSYNLGVQSFWHDELRAMYVSAGRTVSIPHDVLIDHPPLLTQLGPGSSWRGIFPLLRDDIHPPLHFLLLRLVRACFGSSEIAARGISLVAWVLSIILLYITMRMLHGRLAAAWAAGLMAIATSGIQAAQEARNYALLAALAMGAATCMALIARSGITRFRASVLGVLMLAMLLTHYLAIAAIVAIGVFALLCLPWVVARTICMTIGFAGGAFLLLWGWMLRQQRMHLQETLGFLADNPTGHGVATVSRLLTAPARLLVGHGATMTVDDAVATWTVLLPLFVLGWSVWAVLRRRAANQAQNQVPGQLPGQALRFWGIWFWCVVGLLVWLDLLHTEAHLRLVRYMILALPAFCGIFGVFAAGASWRRLVAAGVILTTLSQLPYAYTLKPEWRQAAALIGRDGEPNEPIIFAAANVPDWYPWSMYLALSTYLPADPDRSGVGQSPPTGLHPVALLSHAPDPLMLSQLRKSTQIWVVSNHYIPEPSVWLKGTTAEERFDIANYVSIYHMRMN